MISVASGISDLADDLGRFWKSDVFWGAVAALAALGAIWATLRASHPRRALSYDFNVVPLVQRHEGLSGALEICFNGNAVQGPHIILAGLANSSRRDISSSHFDQSAPIKIRIGASVLGLLSAKTYPESAAAPTATVQGSELHIGPGRIGRGECVNYALLVDGQPNCTLTDEDL
ncbi:hypothetical protein [Streptomyces sp. NPDC006012]|uniref:hypothetical protein n=1 Tax=Streptomyces sp. NPDC006012 TaxID=3364739 RepID=UPI0036BD0F23